MPGQRLDYNTLFAFLFDHHLALSLLPSLGVSRVCVRLCGLFVAVWVAGTLPCLCGMML